MDTSPLIDQERTSSTPPIYAPVTDAASNNRTREQFSNAFFGAVTGASLWMILSRLGLASIVGVGLLEGIIPMCLLGAIVGATRYRRVLAALAAVSLLLLLLIAYTHMLDGPVRAMIRSDTVPPSADAIVVLSAGVTPDGMVPQQGTDRLRKSVELVRRGVAPTLVITRERRRGSDSLTNSIRDQDNLIALAGVTDVVVTGWVVSTRTEALKVAKIARERGWSRITLVTSPMHSRRACRTFEKVGLKVSCVPADSRDIAFRTLGSPDDRVDAFGVWIYELAGTLRYRERGWIDP